MAKRTNLREFQQNLSTRIQQQGNKDGQLSMLGVQIAGQNYLVDMVDVSEVLSLLPLTPVPLTRSWFKGVTNVRGDLYSVIDLGDFLLHGVTAVDIGNRLLLTAARYGVNAAFLVEKVLGLRDTSRWQRDALQENQYFDKYGAQWHKLDVIGLLERPDFLQISI
jgi:twitching motility protein PilI